MTILTRTEYAVSKGWSRQYVGKLAQLGRLVLTMDGKVDVEASDQYLAMTSDPSRSNSLGNTPLVIASQERDPVFPPASLDATPMAAPDYQKARTRLALAQAEKAEGEVLKANGELVERVVVDEAAFASGRMVRDLILALPPKLAPELSAMNDPWDIEKHLMKELRGVLEDAERISTEDFIHALTSTS
ncbi:hypothetical protein [Pseudomonas sp. SJZ131]|uniref:hypothetical protein n=1 Tax=Pseudomonas sp. SJZ131 TaxID=2572895 RepID=UPI00119C86A1|nr:hypothetical protein [Pseudomonas sp. SJZ131]TWD49485.1 hypothetical protein FBY12_1895 [Pseudomonas sp. SJZ131]